MTDTAEADYRTLDPSTGKIIRTFGFASDAEIESVLQKSRDTFLLWRQHSFEARAAVLNTVAQRLDSNRSALATLMAVEMGKPVEEGKAEVDRCAKACRYFAANAEKLLLPEERAMESKKASIFFEPLGSVLSIMPWNFPLWQVFRCAAPALMAGNCTILKHAPNTPQCALEISSIFSQSAGGLELCPSLFLSNAQSARIMSDRRVVGVSLTGSVRAGKAVAREAGAQLKKAVLELGGSDAFLVCADANFGKALEAAVNFRCFNNGQSCISPKRILVARELWAKFVEGFITGMKARRVGDPQQSSTQNGPIAREDLRTLLEGQLARSVSEGAKILLGGKSGPGGGYYFEPTVLVDVARDNTAFREELFGPVGVLIPFDDENQAVSLANDSNYGLGTSIWTGDRERGLKIARKIEAGCVVLNDWVRSEAPLPFGGIKDSGIGRELGEEGIREFVNTKAVW